MELASLLIVAVIIFLCFLYSGYDIFLAYRLKRKVLGLGIPTFKGPPFLGNALLLRKMSGRAPGVPFSVYTLETLIGFRKALQEHDLFVASLGGPFFYVVLSTPSVVEAVLGDTKEINKSQDYVYLHPWLGSGLITSSPVKWKKHRRMLTPAFHFRILDEFQPVISDYSEVMVQTLKAEVGKPFTDLEPFLSACALDVIASTALGVNVDAQKYRDSAYCRALRESSDMVFTRLFSPWMWNETLFWLMPEGRRYSQSLKVIHTFIKKVIQEKKANLQVNEEEVSQYFRDDYSDSKKIRRAFLEIMLLHNIINKDDQFGDQDIIDEVNTFTFAGHDTTTTGMTWAVYMLGCYPEVQEKCMQEIEDIFGDDTTRAITLEDLKKMDYLTRVIKESLRLYPPVPYINRTLQDDFTIKDVTLPKGTVVVASPAVLHRNPESFPNPEVFDPDRFLSTNKHPFSYVPFSAGPRNCIGQRFAMIEMKTLLCNLLRNYKLTSLDPRDKVLSCSELVSKPHQPIRTKLELRNSTK